MAVKNAARPSARERLLAAANELFYEEGVHTVGIDRVIEHAGVAKGSLYNTFGSKDELIRAYLEARHVSMAERITRYIERYDTPRERLLGVFGAQAELFAEGTYRGCAFARASAESHPGDLVEQATEGVPRLGALPVHPPGRGGRRAGRARAGAPAPPALRRQRAVRAPGPRSPPRPWRPGRPPPCCSTRPSPPPPLIPDARRPNRAARPGGAAAGGPGRR